MMIARFLLPVSCLLFLSSAAHASPLPTPPDPRRGEQLDGRTPPRDPYRYALAAPRALLAVPRAIVRAAFRPLLAAGGAAEDAHLWARYYWLTTAEDRKSGVRPTVFYDHGSIGGGLRWFDRRYLGPGSLLQLAASGGTHSRWGVEALVAPSPAWTFRARVERRDDLRFGGLRGETRDELEEMGLDLGVFSVRRARLDAGWADRLAGPLEGELGARLEAASFANAPGIGGDPSIASVWDTLAIPGFEEGILRARLAGALAVDTRDGLRYASGLRVALGGAVAEGLGHDDSRDATAHVELRAPVAIGDRELAFGAAAAIVDPLGDEPVPFTELVSPRGPESRVRGRSMAVASLEYRWLAAPQIDAAMRIEYGGAFGSYFGGFGLDHARPAIAFGLTGFPRKGRYWVQRAVGSLWISYSFDGDALSLVLVGGE